MENRFHRIYEENLAHFLGLSKRRDVPPFFLMHEFMENTLCGDRVDFYLSELQPFIIYYTSVGCSICRASASAIAHHSEMLQSKTLCQEFIKLTKELFAIPLIPDDIVVQKVSDLLQHVPKLHEPTLRSLFEALLSLRIFPTRERCVLLGWECLEEILNNYDKPS